MTVAGGSLVTTSLVADSVFNLLGGTVETGAATFNGQVVVDGGIFDANSMNVFSSFDLLRGTVEMPGTLTLNSGAAALVDGGTLNIGSLQNPERLDFRSGTIILNGDDFIVSEGDEWGGLVRFGVGQTFMVPADSSEVLSNGTLLLEGGKLEVDTLLIEGLVHMSGVGSQISGDLIEINGGELAGQGRISTGNGVENKAGGQITLTGGQLWVEQFLFNEAGALIMGNGTLRVDGTPAITNDGDMAFSGLTNIIGDVSNNATGVILSTGGGPVTFFDDVVNDGEVRTSEGSFTIYLGSYSGVGTNTGIGTAIMEGDFKPGASPAISMFGGDVVFTSTSSYEAELEGTNPGSQHDQINVTGSITINGTLDVTLLNGFTPDYLDEYVIITAGTRSGEYAQMNGLFINDDMTLAPVYDHDGNTGLTLIATIPGDADLDGTVDGFDLLKWQSNLFTGDQWTQGDFNLDGTVNGFDLLIWQSHLFESVQSMGSAAAAAAVSVPEPGAGLLLVFGGAVLLRSRLR